MGISIKLEVKKDVIVDCFKKRKLCTTGFRLYVKLEVLDIVDFKYKELFIKLIVWNLVVGDGKKKCE